MNTTQPPLPPTKPSDGSGKMRPRILVVEDRPEIGDVICEALSDEDYEVLRAADGVRAVQVAYEGGLNLAILDIELPAMNGFEVLKALRIRYSEDALPVIMLSGRRASDDMVEALKMGASDYVTKPFDINVLLARVRRHLSSQRIEETLLSQALHDLWELGRNAILAWCPAPGGFDVLAVPNERLATASVREDARDSILTHLAGPKQMTRAEMQEFARLFDVGPRRIELSEALGDRLSHVTIESLVRRHSVSLSHDRAVALFDIVGFSLFSPLEQVAILNSLSYSLNSAHNRLSDRQIDINFARSTTGDGFYIWNRDTGVDANVNLYHFMHLALADNAIAFAKAQAPTVPRLRACFQIGSHYEFHQSEGLNPTTSKYIVGEVTIELARMIDKALPGQILVGDFRVAMPDYKIGAIKEVNSVTFIEETQETLSRLSGLQLGNDKIESIKCYLTGAKGSDGQFGIKKYRVVDKHGGERLVFNAKVNIHRLGEEPIFLGIQDQDLNDFAPVVA